MFARLKRWSRNVRRDTYAVGLIARDRRVPWYTKTLALIVAGYAFSPLDIIPDFIPVIGFVDDVILVPLGILAVIKLVPPEILEEHRAHAERAIDLPKNRLGGIVLLFIWIVAVGISGWLAWHFLRKR
ncbi:MAG: YkvA family protein [Candidatus Acidiferrales bacterium]